MRIPFSADTRPKKAAKSLSARLSKPLSLCQTAVAEACGYRDWHELANSIATGPRTTGLRELTNEELIEQQALTVLSVATRLGVPDGDVQYALSATPLVGNGWHSLKEQLALRVNCIRKTALPNTGRRERGSIGKLRVAGRNGELVILRKFGRPTYIITHKAPDAMVADFEFLVPRETQPLFIPMRLYLAYGRWLERDGSIVLFSRDYLPLWRIREGRRPERADPLEWIQYTDEKWFWTDESTPWRNARRAAEEHRRLEEFGVIGLPSLVDVLPKLVLGDEMLKVREALEGSHPA